MEGSNSSLRKAAIVVACLEPRAADALLEQMSDAQAALVRRMMVELGDVDPREEEAAIREFFHRGPPAGSLHNEQQPADRVQLQRVESRSNAHVERAESETPFRFLQTAAADALGPMLAGEHPQTITLVVSHLAADQAARLLSSLAPSLQADVMRRLADLDETDPEILRELEQGLHARIRDYLGAARRREAGVAALKRIVEAVPAAQQHAIMNNLARHDAELADKLGPSPVPHVETPAAEFADVEQLDDRALAELVGECDREIVVLALAGATSALVERICRKMPSAEAKALRRAMQRLGPTRLSDVEAAQSEMADSAQRLGLVGMDQRASNSPRTASDPVRAAA